MLKRQWLVCGMMVASSCGRSVDAAPRAPQTEESKPEQAEYDVDFDGETSARVLLEDDDTHVQLAARDGRPLYTMRLRPKGQQVEVKQTYHAGNDGLAGVADQEQTIVINSPMEGELTPDKAAYLAGFLYGGTALASRGNYEQNDNKYGCDFFGKKASCSERGACCDDHDMCFDRLGCKWLTSLVPGSACYEECALPAWNCFAKGKTRSTTGGASLCCASEGQDSICGQKRPPFKKEGGVPVYDYGGGKTGYSPYPTERRQPKATSKPTVSKRPVNRTTVERDAALHEDEGRDGGAGGEEGDEDGGRDEEEWQEDGGADDEVNGEDGDAGSEDEPEQDWDVEGDAGTEGEPEQDWDVDAGNGEDEPNSDDNDQDGNGEDTTQNDDSSNSGDDSTNAGDDSNYSGDDSNYPGDDSNYTGDDSNYAGDDSNYTGDDSNYAGDDSNYAGDDSEW